jgi:hypothetical protein
VSQVKIQGNASGTGIFTVAAPNSNTDRTITLPDATGTVQVSGNPISGTTGSFSGDLSFNSGYGSAAVAYGCRAWVNFNGTGTVAIRASGNVSSITDNATGDYTVNFTTAMPDANYSVVIAASRSSDVFTTNIATNNATGGDVAPTTSAIRVVSNGGPGRGPYDSAYFSVSIFR